MSLLHRIPPLVSALAFGYGVGMTAPETALAPVRVAVGEHRDSGATPAMPQPKQRPASADAVFTPTQKTQRDSFAQRTGGPESRELGRLRDVGPADAARGESCEIERPLFSRPQRLASAGADVNVTDPDDLDMAGT